MKNLSLDDVIEIRHVSGVAGPTAMSKVRMTLEVLADKEAYENKHNYGNKISNEDFIELMEDEVQFLVSTKLFPAEILKDVRVFSWKQEDI